MDKGAMYHFDEPSLVEKLKQLPVIQRAAIAAAAATRQVDNLGRAPEADTSAHELFRTVLETVWRVLASGHERANWADLQARLMVYVTDDSRDNFPEWSVWHALSDDALASLVYAIRTLENGQAQDAAWAVRRAYEAADQAAIRLLGGRQSGDSDAERAILVHPVVQRELGRQAEDLTTASDLQALQARASQSALLTRQEITALDEAPGS